MGRKHRKTINSLDTDEILVDSVSALGATENLEGDIERPLTRFSFFLFFGLVVLSIGYLTVRAFFLQIKTGQAFFDQSEQNRFVVRPIAAPRGIIYDKFKQVLAQNRPSFGLVFQKTEFLKTKSDVQALVNSLSVLLKKPSEFFTELGFPQDGTVAKLPAEIVIDDNIDPETYSTIAPDVSVLPGIRVFENYGREYTDPLSNAHILGYVNKVSEEDLHANSLLHLQDDIGKDGLESLYDSTLRGSGGKKILEINSQGKETRFKMTEESKKGSDLELTIDSELQKEMYTVLDTYTKHEKEGSAVFLNVKTGAVEGLVSYPGFDSNRFGNSLTATEFNQILNDPHKPFFNRAISGEFPSGSVIKPVIASAALQEHLIDPHKKIYDEGFITVPNAYHPGESSKFVDWKFQGWIDMYDAIAQSANVYFYIIGGGYQDQPGLGIDRIKKYANEFGLGTKLGIDIPGERSGVIPDPELKKLTEPDNPTWRIGDTYNAAIGQGGVMVTPLQITDMIATIANGGTLYKPYVVRSILQPDGSEKITTPTVIRGGLLDAQTVVDVHKGMSLTGSIGTAHAFGDLPIKVAAKTGTAQTGKVLPPHAWVTGFFPADDPQIAFTVMVEHAGSGSTVAMPIAKEILKWYMDNRMLHTATSTATSTIQ